MDSKQISIRSLNPGMIVAKDVFSLRDQLILPRNTQVTDLIKERLISYNIPYVWVASDESTVPDVKSTLSEPTLSQRIQSSKEFLEFKNEYDKKAERLKNLLSKTIFSNESIDTEELLKIPDSFLNSTLNRGEIFSIISNLHSDDMTFQHSINTSLYAGIMGKWVGFSAEEIQMISLGGLLHDIGKLKIPSDIIQKKGRLTDNEYKIIQSHALFGYELLKEKKIDDPIAVMALSHHERYDGSGYPFGLKGNKIGKLVTILAIADVFEAITSKRFYKDAVCPFECIRIFEDEGLQQFGPDFLYPILKSIAEIYINHKVLLNNGQSGTVVYINNHKFSKPVVTLENKSYLDLSKEKSLYIIDVL